MKRFFCSFCALILFACSSDDDPAGKIVANIDGSSKTFSASMEQDGFFDNDNQWGFLCHTRQQGEHLRFTYSGSGDIYTLEYYPSYSFAEPGMFYSALPGYQSDVEIDNAKLI